MFIIKLGVCVYERTFPLACVVVTCILNVGWLQHVDEEDEEEEDEEGDDDDESDTNDDTDMMDDRDSADDNSTCTL